MKRKLFGLLTLSALVAPRTASAQFQDARVQAPSLAAPERGSVAGQLASVAFGAADVSRGAFSLPSPLHLASERGEIAAAVLPTYAPDQGQSEWGMGWKNNLAIARWRARGELEFDASDGLVGPWGTMARGDDGAFYPTGLRTLVRVVVSGDTMTARLADGSTWTFGGESRDAGPRGTYAWYLTSTRSVTGFVSTFSYSKNASGRSYLSQVEYGGTDPTRLGHRATFAYEPIARSLIDYRSGAPRLLDQRVSRVTVFSRSTVTRQFVERWHESLAYQNDDVGPAFYLARAQRTFASGEAQPPVTYAYDLVSASLATVAPRRVAKLDALLAGQTLGTTILNPSRSAVLDADEDGRPDLESASDNTLWTQTDDGYAPSPLAPLAATANPFCRGAVDPARSARTLVEMRPSDVEHSVVATFDSGAGGTGLVLCDRTGTTRFGTTLNGDYKLGARVRLSDLDHDQRPDLIRFSGDGFDIVRNTSTADAFAFDPPRHGALSSSTGSDALYVLDVNGDAIVDLVALGDSAARVWYGRGGLTFEPVAARIPALTPSGTPRGALLKATVVFADVNKDGLVDMLVGATGSASLLVNTGSAFQQISVPGLAAVGNALAKPYIGDWAGTGDAEVSYVSGASAYSIGLDRASSGLMVQAKDSAGTSLRFTYDHAPATPGLRQRVSVIRTLEVESTGLDTVLYEYGFARPKLHSEGRFFLGFEGVTRRASLGSQALSFFHSDRESGVLLSTIDHDDLTPGVEKVAFRTYDDAIAFGLPWKRPKTAGEGYQSTDPTKPSVLLEETEFLSYESGVCPTVTRRTGRSGTLTTQTELGAYVGFAQALACIPSHVVMHGSHADTALDFQHQATLTRNAAGQLTRLVVSDGQHDLVSQEVVYTLDGKPSSISTPGQGGTLAEYDPATRLPTRITTPEGVVHEVADRDPVTDAPRSMVTRHGSLSATGLYRYDGRERLAKIWSDVDHSTEARPSSAYTYREADDVKPAMTRTASLVDGTAGIVSDTAELFAADGQSLAKAARIPEGWALADLTQHVKSTRETRAFRSRPVADIAAVEASSLFAAATVVGRQQSAVFGGNVASSELVHTGVERTWSSSLTLDADLSRQELENGVPTKRTALDAAGRLLSTTDAAGARTSFTYDAMGRLRGVRLADGATHKITLDAFGRESRIERSGVASLLYAYDPESGLITTRSFVGVDGVEARRVSYRYDASARVTTETHTDSKSGRSQAFTHYYDGATPENPAARGLTGLLTAITGDGYVKRHAYRADGKLVSTRVEIAGFRSVEDVVTYNDDGSVRSTTRVVRDAAGGELLRTTAEMKLDAYGRKVGELLDGTLLSTHAYDVEGLPAWVQFAQSGASHGEIATFQRDATTRTALGVNLHSVGWSAAVSRRMSARGLVESEDASVGADKRHRSYGYSPQGFLTGSSDEADTYSYSYDAAGLPARILSTVGGVLDERVFTRSGATLTAGSHHHRFDTLGRAVERDDVTLAYGPSGQIETATKGGDHWSFLYDEEGQRIAKLDAGGRVTVAYIQDTYIDAQSMTAPLRVAGSLVGVVRHTRNALGVVQGTFVALPTDARGTAIADSDGALRMASPFGDRATHPDMAAAVDFAAKGWDADLGTVRMGVRDYDPRLGRWLQPDPLYLAEPARIQERPVDGALYAYAMNDPIGLVDPTGTQESPAAQNYINWRDKELAAGHDELVRNTDKGRIVGAGASAAVGAGVAVATSSTVGAVVLEGGIQAWGYLSRISTAGRVAISAIAGRLARNDAAKEEVKQVATSIAPQVEVEVATTTSTAIQKFYPPDMGFQGPVTTQTLSPGTLIDRFGGVTGRFTSPVGTPLVMRALPPGTVEKMEYTVYQVMKPLEVEAGRIAPAFGDIGQGIQYLLPEKVEALLQQGVLQRVQ